MGLYTMAPYTVNQGGAQAFVDGHIDAGSTTVTSNAMVNGLNVWPVPANNVLFVRRTAGTSLCRILTTTGAEVHRQAMTTGANTIDLSAIPPGVYTLWSEDGHTARFVKE